MTTMTHKNLLKKEADGKLQVNAISFDYGTIEADITVFSGCGGGNRKVVTVTNWLNEEQVEKMFNPTMSGHIFC